MKREIIEAKEQGYEMIYLDEILFTYNTRPRYEYCLPGENLKVDQVKISEPALALLMAISETKGVEHKLINQKSITKVEYATFCRELRKKNPNKKLCLFFDKLHVHNCKDSKIMMTDLGYKWVECVTASPDYNAVEFIFSKLKR